MNNTHTSRKIAVLLSGRIYHPDYDATISRLKSLFNGPCSTATYFVSINVPDEETTNFIKRFIIDMNISKDCINIQQVQVPSYVYSFKKKEETDYFNSYSMFYHNKLCFNMLEEHCKKYNNNFDIILKFRTDINYQNPLNIADVIDKNTLYIPSGFNFGGINDQVAYGDYDAMSEYCDCIDDLKSICEEGIFHPETILNQFLIKRDINIVRFPFVYRIKV